MFRIWYFKRTRRFHIIFTLLCAVFVSTALSQNGPEIIWQNSGGTTLAYSSDGQLLLAGTRLFQASDGTVIRDFNLPYNGGGPNSVALSPDGQFAAIGIQ